MDHKVLRRQLKRGEARPGQPPVVRHEVSKQAQQARTALEQGQGPGGKGREGSWGWYMRGQLAGPAGTAGTAFPQSAWTGEAVGGAGWV